MAKKEKEHIIEHQIINLEIDGTDDPQEINDIQQNIIHFYKKSIGDELEKILTKISPPDVEIEIENLEIDVQEVVFKTTAEFERELIKKFKVAAEKEIKAKVKKMKAESTVTKGRKKNFSQMGILEFFLKRGYYPSWASAQNGTASDIFDELMGKKAKATAQRIFHVGQDEKVRTRLFQQFSIEQLELLFRSLYGDNAKKAEKQISIIQKRLDKNAGKAIISAAINYLLKGGKNVILAEFKSKAFTRSVIEDVQNKKVVGKEKTKVRAGFEGTYRDIQILEYFLEEGAIPSWADVDSKKSFQNLFDILLNKELVPLQRMIERHANNANFMQRLIFQFPTAQILKLIEPTSGENIQFIEDSIEDFGFLSSSRENINKVLGKDRIRTTVLSVLLDYFFLQRRNRFVKKTFIKALLEEFAYLTNTSYTALMKEGYKSVRRKTSDSSIRATLEELDDNLKETIANERKELRTAKTEYRKIEKSLEKLKNLQESGRISSEELEELRKLSDRFKKLEKTMEELEDLDMPLEIELLLRQRHELKNQLKASKSNESEKIQKRLENTEKEFYDLQNLLGKEVENLLSDKSKLKEKIGSIAEQRIKRVNNRLSKYQRAVQNVSNQLKLDQQDIVLYLADINKALRGDITTEEKQKLRAERKRLQDELVKINTYLEELKEYEDKLHQALESALAAVDGEEEEDFSPSGTSKLDALIFMLQYGSTPWWAEKFPKQSIEELFLEFAEDSPQKLRSAFQQVGKYPIVWERTVHQLSEKGIKTLLTRLFPNATKVVFAQADILYAIHYSQGFTHLNSVDRKKFQWASILEYLLHSKQSFNPKDFTREITLETSRLYNISPSKLLEYSNNIIENRGGNLNVLSDFNKVLAKDKKVSELERDLIAFQKEKEKQEEGTFLNDIQKLELLVEFISSGKISERAKEFEYKRVEDFEHLLLDQIRKNKASVKHIVLNLLRLSTARTMIIQDLSEDTFWDIVYLVRPKALLPVKRHFKDFKKVFGNEKLELEKDVLLNFFISQQQENFEIAEYIKALLLMVHQSSGRKLIALLGEWKRKIKALGLGSQSSWLMSILLLEVEALKMEQQQIKDAELRSNLQQQLESISKEYSETAKQLADTLSVESAEAQVFSSKSLKLTELEDTIKKLTKDLVTLKKDALTGDALKAIQDKRKIAQLEAELKLLHQQRPPLLRKIEAQIKAVKKNVERLNQALEEETKKGIQLEHVEKEEAYEASLTEQQNEMLVLIKAEAPTVLKDLPALLKELEDADQSNFLFGKDIESLAQSIKDEDYKKALLEILAKALPAVLSLDDLKSAAELDERQKELLGKIHQTSPVQLWKDWRDLEQFYKENPQLQSKEQAALQKQIYRTIKRLDKKNLLAYANILHLAQQKLDQTLDAANSLEELKEIQEDLEVLWLQQLSQADDMIAAAPDEATKNDFKRLKRNINHVFTKLKNKRIRRSNTFLSKDGEAFRQEKVEQTIKVEELEQQKEILMDEIRREEAPKVVVEEEAPKKRRKKKAPVPKKVEEPLRVYNAGMVILWPYFVRLFTMLKYVENKEFVDVEAKYKAIHMLQYLVTGKTQAPENELVLNKLMCNFPLTEPVPFGIEFTEQELQMADGLLKGTIANWPKMKTMSPNALRGSFLVREGVLEEGIDRWTLKVTKKPFDILMKTLPWGYNFIKLPWTEKFISVEWQLF